MPHVPRVIDYVTVGQQMTAAGFACLYHNSGAFGFAGASQVHTRSWIGRPDPTIRPAALAVVRQASQPFEKTMARAARDLWLSGPPGAAWVMPMSHWAFELDSGGKDWMPGLLSRIGVEASVLAGRNTGDAICFDATEGSALEDLVHSLLVSLQASDFMLAMPPRPVLCTIHHHGQLWWQTTDPALLTGLDALLQ
jgi:hypothetical protein